MSEVLKKKKVNEFDKRKVYISIPKDTYDLLSKKIQKMNYRDIKEYIKKKLLVDLLDDENIEIIRKNVNIENNKDNKINRDKILYVRIDKLTFDILSDLSNMREMSISDFVRNIIKDYLEKYN